jgi:replication-associated recombination protein RarA
MPERTSVYFDDENWSHLVEMADGDYRTTSNFLNKLVREEWDRRHAVVNLKIVDAELIPVDLVTKSGDEDEICV